MLPWGLVAQPRSFSIVSQPRIFALAGYSMPFVGNFPEVDSPEIVPLSIDFTAMLPAGDSIASCAGTIEAFYGEDPLASDLLQALATFSGNVVTQIVGGAWVEGVVYSWFAVIATTKGFSLQAYGNVACNGTYAAPAFPPAPTLPGAITLAQLNALLSLLPNVQQGGSIPAQRDFFIDADGIMVISQ